MKNKRRIQIDAAGAVIVIAATVLITFAGTKSTAGATPPPPPEVQVADAEQRDMPVRHEWISPRQSIRADIADAVPRGKRSDMQQQT